MIVNPFRSVKVLAQAGVIRPYRPSRLLQIATTLVGWGTGTAAGAMTLAHRFPDDVGIVDELGALTFAETDRRSNALARGLATLGVGEQGVVAILCRNHRYFIEATVAAAKLGADVIYLNTSFAGPRLMEVLESQTPVVVIHDHEFAALLGDGVEGVSQVLAWVDAETAPLGADTCESLMASCSGDRLRSPGRQGRSTVLTSGTTGAPKGASRGGAGIDAAVSVLSSLPLGTRGVTQIAAPLFHTWGWGHFQLSLLLGSTLVLSRRFEPDSCMRLVEEHGCDALIVIPVMLQRILAEVGPSSDAPQTYDVGSLHVVAASGSALPGDLALEWMNAYGDNLFNIYGSTEVAWATIAGPDDLRAAPGTAGRPPAGTEVRLYDETDRRVGHGATGRIFVRNSMLFEGYTEGGSKTVIDSMMATGDVGRFDDDGRLYVEGRDDDMIVSGGENVYPQEIEDLLTRHPGVADVAVIGVDDADFGQRLRAFVVPRPGHDVSTDELRAHVKAHLARYKAPRDVVFVDELPRTATGKVVRRDLATYDRDQNHFD